MHSIQPPSPQFHGNQTSYVPSTLATAKHVYLRKDSHKHPLQRPYDNPFRVVSKSDKYFTFEIKGGPETVSIDRLKTAYVTPLTTDEKKEVLISPKSILTHNPKPTAVTPPAFSPPKDGLTKTTRGGRVSCVPSRFC
ncbi:Gag-Pol polyprotein [Elysia marginata]|uniref:Gag-Pol polyprotein n=1 Tax=Elysia marginata TaxID=1093978 RepID=A0AAV4EDQ0_9GAST|nr:Gag-Pol polyprotein [Elysia marginata]